MKDSLVGIYEPAPGTKLAKQKQKEAKKKKSNAKKKHNSSSSEQQQQQQQQQPSQPQQNHQIVPSESDEPIYSGKSLYGRAPSQCSSISATQSFDMRMYGRIQPQAAVQPQQQPQQKPVFGTLQKTDKKLENPYYYYGSTRNQKKTNQQVWLLLRVPFERKLVMVHDKISRPCTL